MAQDHPFKIEEWQGYRILQALAGADNLLIAKAAYREAVTCYPQSNITLRQGIRVIEEHKPSTSGR